MSLLQKYPRTPHLPWSRPDESDIWMSEQFNPYDRVVVTEKLDGENTSVYADGKTHARSMDSRGHVSRNYIKGLAGEIAHVTRSVHGEDIVILGENVYAKHSIKYDSLEDWFYIFGIRNEKYMFPWEYVKIIAKTLNLKTVPVLWTGYWKDFKHEDVWPRQSAFGADCEGYVVRNADGFPVVNFRKNVAKYVRPNHIQTDEHWMKQQVVKNGLKYDKF